MVLQIPPLIQRAAGSRVTAATYETDVTDSTGFLTDPTDFVGTQGVAQSIAATTWVPVTLDTSQLDTYTGHNNVTNSSRWTCPSLVPGWYTVCGVVAFSLNGTGARGARLQVNGNPIAGACSFIPGLSSNSVGCPTPARDIFLNGSDYIEVAAWQNSGGALNTSVNSDLSSALWLRFSHA
jgi:hypothetical protein